MGPRGHFYSDMSLAIRDKQVFRGLTGSQRTPGFWGATISQMTIVIDTSGINDIEIFKKKWYHQNAAFWGDKARGKFNQWCFSHAHWG